jgi:hypothetical protein
MLGECPQDSAGTSPPIAEMQSCGSLAWATVYGRIHKSIEGGIQTKGGDQISGNYLHDEKEPKEYDIEGSLRFPTKVVGGHAVPEM